MLTEGALLPYPWASLNSNAAGTLIGTLCRGPSSSHFHLLRVDLLPYYQLPITWTYNSVVLPELGVPRGVRPCN
eukprot:1157349-Pelagomonas_calceolata.AAC.20